jgi:hypothetical protein
MYGDKKDRGVDVSRMQENAENKCEQMLNRVNGAKIESKES